MRVGVMVTNGGPHPPEKWAGQTATHLVDAIQIEPTYPNYEAALQAKNLLEDKLRTALTPVHSRVQDHERGQLVAHGGERLARSLAPDEHMEAAMGAVKEAVKGSMFEDHFAKPEVQKFVASTLAGHFATAMHIERSWHADRNPDDAHSKAFRSALQQGA